MKIEVTQVGRGSRRYRGTVNGEPFVGKLAFCRLVADMATPEDGCIEGIGKPKPGGYYQVRSSEGAGNQHALIRAMFEGLARPPEGLHAAHGECHRRGCVNPHHVTFKTCAQNHHDKLRDGTHQGGERNGGAKITDAERDKIQQLYATGQHTQRELSRQFGITDARVRQIVNAPTWRVVPMTPERAALIRFLVWSGAYTHRQIAKAVNTTEHQVSNIKLGHSWQPQKAVKA
ncbi:MAG: hypothetical protein GY871_09610 [Actinomycetales bacterium]|nr:hypothetical protein [Actinomycetales bacterium]